MVEQIRNALANSRRSWETYNSLNLAMDSLGTFEWS